jgi:hypothetical protein
MYNIYLVFFFVIIFFIIIFYFLFNNKEKPLSFHVLMVTIGRDSIFRILESLKKQLDSQDYLTIIFDGKNMPNIDKVKKFVSDFNCHINVIVEEHLGNWGHPHINKYNKLPGDFIFHVDDDDDISSDCMEKIRSTCKDTNTIYIFKMNNYGNIIWKTKNIIVREISKQMGIIPMHLNSTSSFGYNYAGDYEFYKKLEENGNKMEYIDHLIYTIRP